MGRAGFPIVISGPSGVGKTTICRKVLEDDPLTAYSVSVTTRPPRPGELDETDYEFVSDCEFDALIESGELAEWAVVHGHRYGTRKKAILEVTASGKDVVMDLDVQGGMSIKRLYPDSLLVFVAPPSAAVLKRRLSHRATDDDPTVRRRLDNAREEMTWADEYDCIVVNDDIEETVSETRAAIQSRRLGSP